MSVEREKVYETVPQKDSSDILKGYLPCSLQSSGSVFHTMECVRYLYCTCTIQLQMVD